VGVQQIRRDRVGTEPAGEYGKGNENNELGASFLVHKKIVSAVNRAEFIGDTISYTIQRSLWCDIMVLKVQDPTVDKN
jgi:hypothetical protein